MNNESRSKKEKLRLDIGKKFFIVGVLRHCHRLLSEVVDAPTLSVFEGRLDGAWSSLVCGRCPYLAEGEQDLKGPFQHLSTP